MTAIVAIEAATKRYGRLVALDDVSLDLEPGEAVALIGHNGAGKTTLMKLVLGLIRPSAGTVRVLGEDPAGPRGAQGRRRLGFLPESVSFHGAMTGRELLAFYARLKGVRRDANAALLERVGLTAAAGRRVSTYSKGMCQRLGLAQALIGEPNLLLLDEPNSGLDPESRDQVFATIDDMRRRGATILLSTHALAEIERRVDRVALLHRGRLLALGSLAELRTELSLALTARLSVRACTTEAVLSVTSAYARPIERSRCGLVLAIDPADKPRFVQDLARLGPSLQDLEIERPGLDAIYRHLVARAEEAE